MRNLFAFFFRYHVFFVFILLEITAIGMLIQTHHYQSSRFASSSNSWSGQILEQFNNVTDYFSLKKINRLDFGVGQGFWADTSWVANEINVQVDLSLEQ